MNELTFKSHTLTPIIIKNKPYLGVGQIDLALQYPKHTTCRKIYERHRDVIREVIREEIAPYLLKDGIKEGTFNTSPTADGLPAVNWVIGISHGATALYDLIQQYQKRQKEAVALLESKKC